MDAVGKWLAIHKNDHVLSQPPVFVQHVRSQLLATGEGLVEDLPQRVTFRGAFIAVDMTSKVIREQDSGHSRLGSDPGIMQWLSVSTVDDWRGEFPSRG